MSKITLKGNAINTIGELPAVGSQAKGFKLVATDLSTKKLADFAGKNLILNIFPSVDTGTCAASVRNFNKTAADLNNTSVICISRDLPFAQTSFCASEGLEDVVNLSDMRNDDFGNDYGVAINSGKWLGLLSRAVVVVDENGNVAYTEQVPEIGQEPNYEAALAAL